MVTWRLARSLLRTSPRPIPTPTPWRWKYSTASRTSDSLRILFCGSDAFSCESLKALHGEQKRNADLIRSIDVVVRPSKPTGRGRKVMKEVPLRGLAEQLSLPIHERDTFRGWDMPQPDGNPINLIIAVSFGLFVPPRLIHAAKYGGLNVHPSFLPDLRGPAPIHHALLGEDSHTGITIQTLSPEAFDHGIPLLQTPRPGIPIPPNCTVSYLYGLLAKQGASMLVETLRQGLHVTPHQPYQQQPSQPRQIQQQEDAKSPQLRHAPKITPADKQLNWTAPNGAHQAALRSRVLGPLWTHLRLPLSDDAPKQSEDGASKETQRLEKRVLLEGLEAVEGAPPEEVLQLQRRAGPLAKEAVARDSELSSIAGNWVIKGGSGHRTSPMGQRRGEVGDGEGREEFAGVFYAEPGEEGAVVVQMGDGSWLRVGRVKVEGSTWKPARSALEKMGFGGTGVVEFVGLW